MLATGCAGLIREPIDYSYEACMEESRLVMLTCAKGAMKAANITPREARARDCMLKWSRPDPYAYDEACVDTQK